MRSARGKRPRTLLVLDPAQYYHLSLLWTNPAASTVGSTTYIDDAGGASSPYERCLAYNSLSNQLLVTRGGNTSATQLRGH